MTVEVRVRVFAEAAIRRMRDMERRSKDFRPVLRWAKREIEKANARNFAASGLPVGGWAPLDARYAAWKATNFPGRPIMEVNGRLADSLTRLDGPVNKIRLKSAEFGTDVEYAKFHQYGTSRMPKRQIVYEPKGFARTLAEHTGEYVVYGRFR
jgi:phage gpG-like protein